MDLLAFAAKYWLEFVFTLLAGGITFIFKRYMSLLKKEREEEREELKQNIKTNISEELQTMVEKSDETHKALQEEINLVTRELQGFRKGLLSVQGRQFKASCIKLLDPAHVITLEEYEQIVEDHEAYNSLGGNHSGDNLFELVMEKAKNTLTHDK